MTRALTPEQREKIRAAKRRYYRKHAARISAKNNGPDGWKARNPEKVAAFQKAYRLERLAEDPEWERKSAYKKRYGMTLEEYNAMLEKQHRSCAICFGSPRGRKRFHVDHDHQTDAVRGLLCWRCNSVLGNLDEDVDVMMRMIAYLNASRSPAGKARHLQWQLQTSMRGLGEVTR